MDYTELLCELVRTYSPSGQEEQISNKIRDMLSSELGADSSYIDEVGNVIGVYEGKKPSILLCGHIDTVPGELPIKLEDGYVYGRGTADAKGPMAAFLCTAHALTKTSFDNRLIVACVVDEEGNGKGIRHLINKGIRPEYAVFGEPSSSTNIVIGYRGGLRVRLSFKTQSFHASSPWMGKSAIEAAIELWTLLNKYNEDAFRKEKKFDTISACLTQISGGETHNMSPASCEMAINIRYPPSVSSDRIIQDIHSTVDSLFDDRIKVTVEIDDHTPAYVAPISNELVKSFRNAIKKVTGTDAKLIRKTGSADMNLYGKEMRTPVITFGPGDPKLSHTPNEKVRVEEFLKSIEVIKEALLNLSNSDMVSD